MLLTQCPQCRTIFRVAPEQLIQADGRARCGRCAAAFDALFNLRDRLPADATGTQAPGFSVGALASAGASAAPAGRPGPVFDLSDLPPLEVDDLDFNETDFAEALEQEGFRPRRQRAAAPDAPSRRFPATLGWGIACVALTLTLVAQGMLSRQAVAGFPPLHTLVMKVCALSGCEVPLPREPHRLGLVSRDVQPHPTVDGALVISATMINRAPYPQRWPLLEITLADLNGRVLAMRRFGPDTYLSSGSDLQGGMPPGTPIHVVFETEDPGDQAVAFEFQFR